MRYKDIRADRMAPRRRMAESLDRVFAERLDPPSNLDAVESKLFGLGVESYTVGSHEFYLGYAVSRQTLLCLDAGHFHPTEMISEKTPRCSCFARGFYCMSAGRFRWDKRSRRDPRQRTRGPLRKR